MSNPPECHAWTDHFYGGEAVTWSGDCLGGKAHGEGKLVWPWESQEAYFVSEQDWKSRLIDQSGIYRDGRQYGRWIFRFADGEVHEGHYVEGRKNGQWTYCRPGGFQKERTEFSNGKKHGISIKNYDNGTEEFRATYVDGQLHGKWVSRFEGDVTEEGHRKNGMVHEEGFYVNGERHGKWDIKHSWHHLVFHTEATFAEGKMHGQFVSRYFGLIPARHSVLIRSPRKILHSRGDYVNDKAHGHWVFGHINGRTSAEGSYLDGKKHGHWVSYDEKGRVEKKGNYSEGKKHGFWVEYNDWDKWKNKADREAFPYEEGSYVKGERHGRWIKRDLNKSGSKVTVTERFYEDGIVIRTEALGTERVRGWKGR